MFGHGHSHDGGHGHSHDGGHGHSHAGGQSHSHDEGHGHSHSSRPSFLMPFWNPQLLGEERNFEIGPRASSLESAGAADNEAAHMTPSMVQQIQAARMQMAQRAPFPPEMMQQMQAVRMQMMQRAPFSPEMMQQMLAVRMQMMQSAQMTPEMMQQVQAATMRMMQQVTQGAQPFPNAMPLSQAEEPVHIGAHSPTSPVGILMKRLSTLVLGKGNAVGCSEYERELEREIDLQGQFIMAVMAALLEQYPGAVSDRDESGKTLLHHACLSGQLETVDLLLRHDPDVNSRDNLGATAVHMAAKRGKPVILQRLRERGADMRQTDDIGQTAMHYAAAGCSASTLHYLSECCGLSYSDVDTRGKSLLHAACEQLEHNEAAAAAAVVALLLRHNRADPQLRDADGCNAMHYAARAPLLEVCHHLASAGSSRLVMSVNNAGVTPLDIARRGSSHEHYCTFRDMELWLQKSQPHYPGLSKPTEWFWNLVAVPGYFLLAVVVSFLLTPNSQGWIVTLGMCLSYVAAFSADPKILHGEAFGLPNPIHLGATIGYMVLTLLVCCCVILPAVYSGRPVASFILAATIPVTLYLYVSLCTGDPGFSTQSKQKETGGWYTMQDLVTVFQRPHVWCNVCEIVPEKPTKHCSLCRRCCFKLDEHCTYIMNCVGNRNRQQYVWLCAIVVAQQLLFCSLAASYFNGLEAHSSFWGAVCSEFNRNAWVVGSVAASVICLPFTSRHLLRTLDLLSKGYTATFQPLYDDKKCSLSMRERTLNVFEFFVRGRLRTNFVEY